VTRAQIEAELERVDAQIDAAYWAFTRQARAKPPVLAVPAAYERRAQLHAMLRELGVPIPFRSRE
jgi:hypothetical protein